MWLFSDEHKYLQRIHYLMEQRTVSTLPLAPLYKTRLHNAGYITMKDLASINAERLSVDTGLGITDCQNILQIIENCKTCVPRPRSGCDAVRREEAAIPVMTFSQQLDQSLGGGIHCGTLTEVCGVPGVGKTQLCIQLACDIQIPSVFGGLEGEAVYIDTEGGFIIDRVMDIVTATVQHCHNIPAGDSIDIGKVMSTMTVEKLLSGIHVYSCHDSQQLLAIINLLPELLSQNKKIKLVIIDSVSFHFRHDFEDLSLRTRILTHLAQNLVRMARQFDIAVAVTNQMTTKIQGSDKGSHLVPCLGESWGHAVTTRVILQYDKDQRQAWVYKSPSLPQSMAPYQVTKDGIRDIVIQEQFEGSPDNFD